MDVITAYCRSWRARVDGSADDARARALGWECQRRPAGLLVLRDPRFTMRSRYLTLMAQVDQAFAEASTAGGVS